MITIWYIFYGTIHVIILCRGLYLSMAENKLLRSAVILTVAHYTSNILGLIYMFPFAAIVGQKGIALYSYGYLPYTVILSFATLGVPQAVSKFVSKYNSLGDYYTGRKLFKSGMLIMGITGFIAFLLLFFLAPQISNWIIKDPSKLQGNSMEDIVFTIRMVSFALIIVPFMSIIRGYFQGFQSMGPTAVSQVVEQIVRIIFILSLTFIIVGVMKKDVGLAVGFATFGAFVGALGALTVLLIYWFKRKEGLNELVAESTVNHQIPLKEMYKELISYALPISFVGLAIPLFQLIDLFTFNNALMSSGYEQEAAEVAFAALSQSAHKIILIPVSLATALSITLVPTITQSYTNQDGVTLRKQITQTYQIILFLAIPAAVGLSMLAYSAFGTLYGLADVEVGGYILQFYAPASIFFALFLVTAAILQGMNRQKTAVMGLVLALLIKLVLNYGMIYLIGPLGAILTTFLGFSVALFLYIRAIGKYADYHYLFIAKRTLLISIFVTMMGIVVYVTKKILYYLIGLETWSDYMLTLFVSAIIGAFFYMYISIRSNLAGQIFGSRFAFLQKRKK